MSIHWYFSGIVAALGASTVLYLAPPQSGASVTAAVQAPAQKLIRKSAPKSTLVPAVSAQSIARVSAGQIRKHGSLPASTVQGTGPAPVSLAVYSGGQIVPALAMDNGTNPIPVPGVGQWFNIKIFVPATGQPEYFVLGIPNVPASVQAPMLVGMRQSGVSHGDITAHTTFWDECLARGWYLLAPLSGGVPPSALTNGGSTLGAQLNTEAALEWVTDRYPIDSNRIYAVGFSGGGSLVTSYAGRHLDPSAPMFAAVVVHTGAVDFADIYAVSGPAVQVGIAAMMGGTPTTIPFEYRRISGVHLDAAHLWQSGGDHGARNFDSIPTQIWYATNDTHLVLVQQTTQMFDWMDLNGNGPVELFARLNPNPFPNGEHHNWSLLDETQICDWFDQQVLTPPLAGELLMDRNAVYHYFDLQQDQAGAFSRLSFVITLGTNHLALTGTENIQSLTLTPSELGLFNVSGVLLTLELEAQDSGDEIVLEGIDSAPLGVLRDGSLSASWVYSATEETLTISEPQTGTHVWTLQF